MEPRRFRLWFEDDGREVEFFCAAWPTMDEREQSLAGVLVPEVSPSPTSAKEPRGPGRPATQRALLEQAVEALGSELDPALPLARRRRLIEQYLVRAGVETLPARSTTEDFLTSRLSAENPAGKSPEKSARRRIPVTGG